MAEISKQALIVENNTAFPNNNNGSITPSDLRAYNVDVIDSTVNQTVYTTDSASWNNKIAGLEAFTGSQQPSFNALNAFTASQSVVNTNLNAFTQSATQELDSLSAWTGSWEAWTSSLNEIRDDGVLQGYSTRFYFNGLVSASIVANVGGPIANVTIQQDGTKLNTASFNDYTASNAASQSVFSASVATTLSSSLSIITALSSSLTGSINSLNAFTASQTSFNTSATASISQLLALSSSLSGGYATQGELDQSASVLQANIDTKLGTASFNAFTQSQSALNGTFATTGSNTFIGNQIITGSVKISGSAIGAVISASIVSSTASIDLSIGDFFTLTLSGSINTNINITNPQPGTTALLRITNNGINSASFSSNVLQPKFNSYIPTSGSSVDLLSLAAFDTATVYVTKALNFV